MSGILFLGNDQLGIFALAKLAQPKFRFKHTDDPMICKQWIASQDPALIVVSGTSSPRTAVEIAAFAWAGGFKGTLLCCRSDKDFDHELAVSGFVVVDRERLVSAAEEVLRQLEISKIAQPKALIVDDLDIPRDVICAFVEKFGYEAVGASSAADALTRLVEAPGEFSCVITDINMPKVKGTELIRQIRESGAIAKIPIIVLTAYGTGDCLVESMEAGASGFLVKPPRKDDMQRELARAARILRGTEDARLISRLNIDKLREAL
jgi:CheY-like chemotaxis protein